MRVTIVGQLDFGTYECPKCSELSATTYFRFWNGTTVGGAQVRYAVCPNGHLFTEDPPECLSDNQKAQLIRVAQKQ